MDLYKKGCERSQGPDWTVCFILGVSYACGPVFIFLFMATGLKLGSVAGSPAEGHRTAHRENRAETCKRGGTFNSPWKTARAKTSASSRLQDVTSQTCLHSSSDDSFSRSFLTEPDSVSRCKQEELTCGLGKQSFKGSRRANKTKNALGFAADARTELGRGPSEGGFVDAKFLHEVIKKKKHISSPT